MTLMDLVLSMAEDYHHELVWTDFLLDEWEHVIARSASSSASPGWKSKHRQGFMTPTLEATHRIIEVKDDGVVLQFAAYEATGSPFLGPLDLS